MIIFSRNFNRSTFWIREYVKVDTLYTHLFRSEISRCHLLSTLSLQSSAYYNTILICPVMFSRPRPRPDRKLALSSDRSAACCCIIEFGPYSKFHCAVRRTLLIKYWLVAESMYARIWTFYYNAARHICLNAIRTVPLYLLFISHRQFYRIRALWMRL